MVSNFQPTLFYTLLGIYHLLPLHAPLTLFVLDAPFGRFASKTSRLNVNGNIAWFSMEIVAPLTFLMTLYPTFPTGRQLSLSIMYLIHYAHRAVLSPLILSPKRSKLHIIVPLIAAGYNALNAYLLAIYLTTSSSPSTIPRWQFMSCCVGWTLGFLGNVYHDELLNDLRRPADKRLVSVVELTNEKEDKKVGKGRYMIPRGGLFELVSFPNYLCEWLEWTFFALASAPITLSLSPTQRSHLPGPTAFWPAKLLSPPWMFVVFEISAMLPRALRGHRWYRDTFGVRYPIKRRAVVPWVL